MIWSFLDDIYYGSLGPNIAVSTLHLLMYWFLTECYNFPPQTSHIKAIETEAVCDESRPLYQDVVFSVREILLYK